MKRFFALAVAAAVLLPAVGGAQTATSTLADPGTLPDSPFYFLKEWKEGIQLFFTFDAEKKAEQYLHLADVRLAEYEKMIEKGKEDIAARTLEKYQDRLDHALAKAEELKTKGSDVGEALKEKAKEAASKHLEVLRGNLEKVPEAAQAGIMRALDESQKQLEKLDEIFGNAFEETSTSTEPGETEGADDSVEKAKSDLDGLKNIIDDKGLNDELDHLLDGVQ